MAATYVTAAELKTNLGIGTLYPDSVVEEVCQSAQDLINEYLWFNSYPVVGVLTQSGYGVAVLSVSTGFTAGQSIHLSDCGSQYNGDHVITSTYPYTQGSGTFPFFSFFPFNQFNFPRGYSMVQFALTGAPNDNYHLIVPYGKALGTNYKETAYANTPLVREAALMIATDIWQARQQSNAGGISPDFAPSPYRMGNQLMARVRGLLAPYISPRSMVG